MRCHVEGNDYKDNAIIVSENKIIEKMLLRNMKIQQNKMLVADTVEMCSIVHTTIAMAYWIITAK